MYYEFIKNNMDYSVGALLMPVRKDRIWLFINNFIRILTDI
jgi:hypothetical protein